MISRAHSPISPISCYSRWTPEYSENTTYWDLPATEVTTPPSLSSSGSTILLCGAKPHLLCVTPFICGLHCNWECTINKAPWITLQLFQHCYTLPKPRCSLWHLQSYSFHLVKLVIPGRLLHLFWFHCQHMMVPLFIGTMASICRPEDIHSGMFYSIDAGLFGVTTDFSATAYHDQLIQWSQGQV